MAFRLGIAEALLSFFILINHGTKAHRSVGEELHLKLLSASENKTTFFHESRVYQYNNYGSLEIFQVTVPPGTALLKWYLGGVTNDRNCTGRKIISHIQSGGYPLFTPDGRNASRTFPSDNYYLNHETLYNVTVMSNDSRIHILHVNYPQPGQWFLVAYVSENVDQVIKKITSSNCRYGLRVEATASVPRVSSTQDLSYDKSFNISMQSSFALYKFFVGEYSWKYRVTMINCRVDNSNSSECPVNILARGGSFPSPGLDNSYLKRCTESPCTLDVSSPLLNTWHFLALMQDTTRNITFTLSIDTFECEADDIYRSPQEVDAGDDGDEHVSENDTRLKFHKHDTSKTQTTQSPNTENGTHEAGPLPSHITTSKNITLPKGNDQHITGTGNVTNMPNMGPQLKGKCPYIYRLQRLESANSDFYTSFTLNPTSDHEVLYLSNSDIGVIRFDVLPMKDTAGSLVIRTKLRGENITLQQNISILSCVQVDKLPVNGDMMRCDNKSTMFNMTQFGAVNVLYFPYPHVGMWFLSMQAVCFNKKTSKPEPCQFRLVPIEVTIEVLPCVEDSCGRYGSCQSHSKGAFDVTACSCVAGYQGFACTDATIATKDGTQLAYTLLLTLSNMFFWPSIIVATYRGYYAEAVVYFANMFFSTMYHACDVAGMSVFKECIMPYGVLSYCDFFCSIMSFWVTLLAVARLPATLRSVAQMVGVFGLAMGVEWQTHGLWPYVVPIATGIAIVVISWVVRCIRGKKCYPKARYMWFFVPGIAMAILGICIFAFIETDKNYPYTHSAWHVCMSTCVVFLLPNRKQTIKDDNESEASDMFDLGGVTSEAVGLVRNEAVIVNAASRDDIDL